MLIVALVHDSVAMCSIAVVGTEKKMRERRPLRPLSLSMSINATAEMWSISRATIGSYNCGGDHLPNLFACVRRARDSQPVINPSRTCFICRSCTFYSDLDVNLFFCYESCQFDQWNYSRGRLSARLFPLRAALFADLKLATIWKSIYYSFTSYRACFEHDFDRNQHKSKIVLVQVKWNSWGVGFFFLFLAAGSFLLLEERTYKEKSCRLLWK